MKKILQLFVGACVVFLSITVVHAGSLSPSATPAATSYTLDDIYTRLTTNATATLGDHDFAPGGAPAGSLYTLTQIYSAVPTIDATAVKSGTTYLGVAGTLLPNTGTATVAGVFTGVTVHVTSDWTLDIGTLTRACAVSTFNATANLVPNAYDGDGDGSNRWCMTDSGDAIAGDILSGKIAWVDGTPITGTIATRTLSASTGSVVAGYYEATTLAAVDTDLTAANVKEGIVLFGVTGTNTTGYAYGSTNSGYVLGTATASGSALVNIWNGGNTDVSFPGGSQANGGVDDYNNGGAVQIGRYAGPAGWTSCTVGNSYCGTGDSKADAKDNSTGLIWSLPCNGSGCTTLADASPYPAIYSWNTTFRNNDSKTASQLCSDHSGWALPHQKQFQQAYVDGSYGNMEAAGTTRNYWTATTQSDSPLGANAWYASLSFGTMYVNGKAEQKNVRCVRTDL